MGSLNRRALFGAVPVLGALAIPAAANAKATPVDEWEVFIAGVSLIDPRLADEARAARAGGYEVSDCYAITAMGGPPALCFGRQTDGITGDLMTFQNGKAH